jgi:hypothetical protein
MTLPRNHNQLLAQLDHARARLDRGQKPGAAAYRYKDKFNDWPPLSETPPEPPAPLPPTAEVMAWDRHCRIRYAKSMSRAANG